MPKNQKEFEQVIWNCALRYALGRRSYITGVVGDFIMDRVDELTPTTKSIMIRDIEEADDLGHGCDKKTWLKLFNELKQ